MKYQRVQMWNRQRWDCATHLRIWPHSCNAEMLNFVWCVCRFSTHLHCSELSCFDKPHMLTQSHYWKTATFMVNYNLPPPNRIKAKYKCRGLKWKMENLTMKHQPDQYKCNCFPLVERCHTRFAADLWTVNRGFIAWWELILWVMVGVCNTHLFYLLFFPPPGCQGRFYCPHTVFGGYNTKICSALASASQHSWCLWIMRSFFFNTCFNTLTTV